MECNEVTKIEKMHWCGTAFVILKHGYKAIATIKGTSPISLLYILLLP